MLDLQTIRSHLEELLPSKGLSDSCPNGLQVEGKRRIAKVATAVSASLGTIQAAIQKGVDALIVHHGLFWLKDSYIICGTKKEKLSLLLENDISLFAYHLPLDMHPLLGNNWKAAKDLGWLNLQPFCYLQGVPIGVRGDISPLTKDQLKVSLEQYYQHDAVCAWGGPDMIQTIALVSGGAHKTIVEAAAEGIDAFITGSFDEPTWNQALEEKINFFALGHSATERIGPLALAAHIEQVLQCPCEFIDTHNPF